MINCGFVPGAAGPCVFPHKDRGVRAVVNGDDCTIFIGNGKDLDWFGIQITKRFEVKFKARLASGGADDRSVRILNRIIAWFPDRIECEADQRRAEIIITQMGLTAKDNSVVTPCAPTTSEDEAGDLEPLDKLGTSMFRAMAARANHLAQERSDI